MSYNDESEAQRWALYSSQMAEKARVCKEILAQSIGGSRLDPSATGRLADTMKVGVG